MPRKSAKTDASLKARSTVMRLRKVGECLYRLETTGMYYALVKKSGRQIRRSLNTTDRKLAERKLKDFREAVGGLTAEAIGSTATFEQIARQWLDSQAPALKASSFLRRDVSLRQVLPHIGHEPLRTLTTPMLERWASKRSREVAASTYNKERDLIEAVFEYAKRNGLVLNNPATHLIHSKQSKRIVRIPTREEFSKMLTQIRQLDVRSVHAAILVELLAYSGMRLAEATALRWEDVDFAKDRFIVTGGADGPKNRRQRVVPLFPALRTVLERVRAERDPAATETISEIESARRAMRHACKLAKLPEFTHHSLRHYFVSNAIEAGADFKVIAEWIGHQDGGILVAQTYGHLRDAHSFETAKRMTFE